MTDPEEAAARRALCIAMALALAGCNRAAEVALLQREAEAIPVAYQVIGMIAGDAGDPESARARNALSDGFLSEAEYDRIMEIREDRRKQEVLAQFTTRRQDDE